MPIFSSQLGKVESYNPEQSIKTMANHLRKIQEELEYRLMNLDSTNINEINASDTNVLVDGKPIQNVLLDQEGNYSALEQTVNGLASTVANQAGSISSLQQTAGSLSASVSNLETGMGHMLKMDANGVYIVDQNGNAVTISGGQIDASTLTVNAANITGTLAVGRIPSSIARTSQLMSEDDVTTITHNAITTANISANQITSGTLNANYVNIKGLLKILVGGSTYGWIGGTDVGSTAGAVLTGPSTMHGCMATNTGAKLTYNLDEHKIWVDHNGCWSNVDMDVYSDRRLKNTISYDLEAEERMFMQLKPCTYRLNSDAKKKTRWGFIAQEVIEGAESAGLDPEKLAVVNSSEDMYGLAYGQFTALNTHMIQKLMKRVAALEEART